MLVHLYSKKYIILLAYYTHTHINDSIKWHKVSHLNRTYSRIVVQYGIMCTLVGSRVNVIFVFINCDPLATVTGIEKYLIYRFRCEKLCIHKFVQRYNNSVTVTKWMKMTLFNTICTCLNAYKFGQLNHNGLKIYLAMVT